MSSSEKLYRQNIETLIKLQLQLEGESSGEIVYPTLLALLLAVWSRLMLEHVLSLSLVCDANT